MKEKIQVFPMSENFEKNLPTNTNEINGAANFLIVDMNQNLIEATTASVKSAMKSKQLTSPSSVASKKANSLSPCNEIAAEDTIKNELAENLEEFYLKTPFNKLKLNKIIESAIHWSLVNGFVIVPKDRDETDLMVCTYLPFTLCPTPIRKRYFDQVMNLQPDINLLVNKIANSPQMVKTALEK
jgi:hypothetical protein